MDMELLKKKVNIKNIIRVLSCILIVFFFVPTFLVSCSGEEVKISAKTIMTGVKSDSYGQIIAPHFGVIVLLLLPIALLAIWFIKEKMTNKLLAIVTAGISVFDLILWFVMKSEVKKAASAMHCGFSVKGAFVVNIIILLIIAGTGIMLYMEKITPETVDFNNIGLQKQEKKILFCETCGAVLPENAKFCTKCGAKTED